MSGELTVISQDLPVRVKRGGKADIIGFGQDGVYLLRNNFHPSIRKITPIYSYNDGWRKEAHVRIVGDTTGNNLSDIIGFGNPGVYTSLNNGDGTFGPQVGRLGEFGSDQGWNTTKHIRLAADLRKVGYVDIIAFGDNGVYVSKNNGDGTFAPSKVVLADFGYIVGGWRLDKHLRFLADTTGNGLPDIVGFGESLVYCATNKGDGTFNPGQILNVGPNFTPGSGGWQIGAHPRALADLTGDKRADIIGFGGAGVWISYNNGNGTYRPAQLVINNFGADQGWQVGRHPRFVVDLTGDGRADIIGFGGAGVYVAKNKGNGTFEAPKLVLSAFAEAQGWNGDAHPRFVVDITGNGCADIVGFGQDAIYVAYSNGDGTFGHVEKLTPNGEFSLNAGWDAAKTVRWVTNLYQ